MRSAETQALALERTFLYCTSYCRMGSSLCGAVQFTHRADFSSFIAVNKNAFTCEGRCGTRAGHKGHACAMMNPCYVGTCIKANIETTAI